MSGIDSSKHIRAFWQQLLPGGKRAAAFLSAIATGLLVAHLLARAAYGSLGDGLDSAALVLIALALAPWIASVVSSVEFGEYKLTFVKQELRAQRSEIEALKFLVLSLVSEYEIDHLKRLAGDDAFVIEKDRYRKQFERELRHMRDLGLIETLPERGVDVMYNDPGSQADVRANFKITEQGRRYLEMRSALERDVPNPV